LIEALGEAVREGAIAGDLDLVRVATQALAALVGGSGEKGRWAWPHRRLGRSRPTPP